MVWLMKVELPKIIIALSLVLLIEMVFRFRVNILYFLLRIYLYDQEKLLHRLFEFLIQMPYLQFCQFNYVFITIEQPKLIRNIRV